jgi:hypothetical protein
VRDHLRRQTEWLCAAALLTAVVSCDRQPRLGREARQKFALDSLVSFGDSAPSAPVGSRAAFGGPALSRILDVAEGPGGDVYVLDSDYKKVGVYGATGAFKRIVVGGIGEGPGEFSLPNSLDVDQDGRVYVGDFNLLRTNIFDAAGAFVRYVTVPFHLKDILVSGDSLLGTLWLAHQMQLGGFSFRDGSQTSGALNVSDEDNRFSPGGSNPRLGRARDNSPLVALQRPGMWYSRGQNGWTLHGASALPLVPPWVVNGEEQEAGHALGIGEVNPNLVVLLYLRNIDAPGYGVADPPGVFLDVFSKDGTYLGTATVPHPWAVAFTTSPNGDFLYIAYSRQYPHVVKYRLRKG